MFTSVFQVQGMEHLNGCDPIKIKVLGPYTFSIGAQQGTYVKGGQATQVNGKIIKKELCTGCFIWLQTWVEST